MKTESLLENVRENKIASVLVVLGGLNSIYSVTVENWLGLLISIVVIILALSEVLEKKH